MFSWRCWVRIQGLFTKGSHHSQFWIHHLPSAEFLTYTRVAWLPCHTRSSGFILIWPRLLFVEQCVYFVSCFVSGFVCGIDTLPPSSRTRPWSLLSLEQKWVAEKKKRFWRVGRCQHVRMIAFPPSVSRLFRQCGIPNISQPYRPPRTVTGIALLLLYGSIARLAVQRNADIPACMIGVFL
jgi:hypothetical protein